MPIPEKFSHLEPLREIGQERLVVRPKEEVEAIWNYALDLAGDDEGAARLIRKAAYLEFGDVRGCDFWTADEDQELELTDLEQIFVGLEKAVDMSASAWETLLTTDAESDTEYPTWDTPLLPFMISDLGGSAVYDRYMKKFGHEYTDISPDDWQELSQLYYAVAGLSKWSWTRDLLGRVLVTNLALAHEFWTRTGPEINELIGKEVSPRTVSFLRQNTLILVREMARILIETGFGEIDTLDLGDSSEIINYATLREMAESF